MRLDSYLMILQHRSEPVKLSAVPEELQRDLRSFMYGRTITKIDNEFAFGCEDFNEWVDKLRVHGVDYDIVVE